MLPLIRFRLNLEIITLMLEGTDIFGRRHENNFEANAWLAFPNILGAHSDPAGAQSALEATLARFWQSECARGAPVVQRPRVAARISGSGAVLG